MKISIQMSKEDFVYDVQGLCKSFYPSVPIEIVKKGTPVQDPDLLFMLELDLGESYVQITLLDCQNRTYSQRTTVEESGRRAYKNSLKKTLYSILQEYTGKQLLWGTLTGVRPTKLIMERLECGDDKQAVDAYMKQQYYCTQEKIDLGYEIARKELDLLHAIDYKNGYSLYVGIPFCPTRCSYCSFPSYPMEQYGKLVEAYLQALFREITYVAEKRWNRQLSTVYIGGGTPTTLTAEQLQALLQKIRQCFPMEQVREFTVEAGRPDSITREKLRVMKEAGVTRISINPQTMNPHTLERIGRRHTVDQVKQVFRMAREEGHEQINMDLIMGLPGEDAGAMEVTMQELEKLDPDNITVHALVLKRAARLNVDRMNENEAQRRKNGKKTAHSYQLEEASEGMSDVVERYARKQGYEPYYMYRQKNATGTDSDSRENIGYAKKGKECIYNILIMEEKQSIVALGAGASSKFLLPYGEKKIERVENVKSVTDYIARIDEMIERKEQFWKKHREAFP